MALAVLASPAHADDPNAGLVRCVQRTSSGLPKDARDTLARIDGLPRQVLALRSYVRARNISDRWTWSPQEVTIYMRSPEHAAAESAVNSVSAQFAAENPGYRLYANTQIRDLDIQLSRYNQNLSVGRVADTIVSDAAAACTRAPEKFADWLSSWRPPVAANLAAPGLSPHGQARAFDFQVYKGDILIAGTDSGQITDVWIGRGWADRLARAVRKASPAFEGPLQSPNEPWHYTYVAKQR